MLAERKYKDKHFSSLFFLNGIQITPSIIP